MNKLVKATPIEWIHEIGRGFPGFEEWTEARYGFHIRLSTELTRFPYIATWGEGDSDEFATLEEAQDWCQKQIDEWVRENVIVLEQP